MIIHRIDSNYPIDKIIEFCSHSKVDPLPGAVNMSIDDWENKNYTLLYTLYKQKRYDDPSKSAYLGIEFAGKIIAAGGYYPLDSDPNIAILMSRMYTIPKARNQAVHGKFLFPRIMSEVAELNYQAGLVSYNQYNLWMRTALMRASSGRGIFLGIKTPDEYRGWTDIEQPLMIKNTPQWCLYKLFNPTYLPIFLKSIDKIKTLSQ
jgi:hypothetical protein